MGAKHITREIANILATKVRTKIYEHYKTIALPHDTVKTQIEALPEYKEFELALAKVEAAKSLADKKRDIVADLCDKLHSAGPYTITIFPGGNIQIRMKNISERAIADEILLNSFLSDEEDSADDLIDEFFTAYIS